MNQRQENDNENGNHGCEQSVALEEETESLLFNSDHNDGGQSVCESRFRDLRRERRAKFWQVAFCIFLLGIQIPIFSVLFRKDALNPLNKKNDSNWNDTFSINSTVGQVQQNISNYSLLIANYPPHKLIQIANYKAGLSLIVNFHITHHAGTTLCYWATANGPTPPFACMKGKGNETIPNLQPILGMKAAPWYYNETDDHIQRIRPVFHYISWEYGLTPLTRSVNATDWEHSQLVSIIVMRNPIDRLLSDVGRHVVKNDTVEEWWDYANQIRTNNYALRTIMSLEGCCQGAKTSESYVEAAKTYLQRFTFIIDMDCLEESIHALSSILGLKFAIMPPRSNYGPAKERIHNDTLYDYLIQRNAKDLELYEWSKQLSLVKCQADALN